MSVAQRTWIGKDVPRLEDPKLLTGRAIYVDDVKLPGLPHAAVLRSPHAHARIKRIETSKARSLPGVFAIITGEDARELSNPLVAFCAEPVVQYALAVDKVRYAGEAVAAVAAVDRYVAEDALALVAVEYEPLPVVTDPFEAMAPEAPALSSRKRAASRNGRRRLPIRSPDRPDGCLVQHEHDQLCGLADRQYP